MSNAYNSTDYNPPIPILSIRFGYGDRQPWLGPYDAIVDTGADATIVPEEIPLRLRAIPLNPVNLVTQWGESHPATAYLVHVGIGDIHLAGIVVAGDPTSHEIILGRNLLNRLALLLDGPQAEADVLDGAILQRLRSRRR